MDVALSLPVPAIQASGADSSDEVDVVPAVEKHAQTTVFVYNLHLQPAQEGVQAGAGAEVEAKNMMSLIVAVVAEVVIAVEVECE